jgi:P27 family predicted phage terminase small subunit
LLKETRGAWTAYWASEVAKLATEVDLPAVRRLFRYYDQHARAMDIAVKMPAVKGSTGQVKVSPFAGQALKLEEKILRLENELGLTPMARMRLGIATGEAAASLAEMNRLFAAGGEGPDVAVEDPRLRIIDTSAS